jgi:hypothetical protein
MANTSDLKSDAINVAYWFESHLPHALLNRLLDNSIIKGDCIIWKGAIRGITGYGAIKYEGKVWDVHRLVGTFLFGDLDRKNYICHRNECSSRLCFSPKHLYKGSPVSNVKDSINKGNHSDIWNKKLITHCKNEHEFTKENTRIDRFGYRDCRLCNRDKMRARRAKK